MGAEARLRELAIELPPPQRLPAGTRGNFRLAQRSGNLVYLSGSGPLQAGEVVFRGKVGAEVSAEDAYQAARLTGLNLLANLRAEIGDLDRVVRWVKVLGMVNSAPGFNQQPTVINGFSDLIVDIFGEEIGLHARSAVGMAELPFGMAVEVEAIVEVE